MTRAALVGTLELGRATYDALITHARSDAPFEVCGLLAGEGGEIREHHPIPNAARSMTYYSMDPKAMLLAMREMDDLNRDLVAIYHSHSHTEAFPSPTDVELAAYPDAVCLIVSLQEPDAPVIRGFDIRDGKITERVITVDGLPAATGPR